MYIVLRLEGEMRLPGLFVLLAFIDEAVRAKAFAMIP